MTLLATRKVPASSPASAVSTASRTAPLVPELMVSRASQAASMTVESCGSLMAHRAAVAGGAEHAAAGAGCQSRAIRETAPNRPFPARRLSRSRILLVGEEGMGCHLRRCATIAEGFARAIVHPADAPIPQ